MSHTRNADFVGKAALRLKDQLSGEGVKVSARVEGQHGSDWHIAVTPHPSSSPEQRRKIPGKFDGIPVVVSK